MNNLKEILSLLANALTILFIISTVIYSLTRKYRNHQSSVLGRAIADIVFILIKLGVAVFVVYLICHFFLITWRQTRYEELYIVAGTPIWHGEVNTISSFAQTEDNVQVTYLKGYDYSTLDTLTADGFKHRVIAMNGSLPMKQSTCFRPRALSIKSVLLLLVAYCFLLLLTVLILITVWSWSFTPIIAFSRRFKSSILKLK